MQFLIRCLLVGLLGSLAAGVVSAQESNTTVYAAGKPLEFHAMLDALSRADVVFIGENHDHAQGHALELAILKGLHERHPDMALGMEMFERDTQIVLDEYLAGTITDSSFAQASRPWPNIQSGLRRRLSCSAKRINCRSSARTPRAGM